MEVIGLYADGVAQDFDNAAVGSLSDGDPDVYTFASAPATGVELEIVYSYKETPATA